MQRARIGDLDVHIVGDLDAAPELTVILMHGYGAPATDLVDLASLTSGPDDMVFVFPAAPLELGMGGRAWWPIDIAALQVAYQTGRAAELWHAEPEGLGAASSSVQKLLQTVATRTRRPPVLGGFSQGAILACDVAFRSEQPLSGLVVLSGAPVAEPAWRDGMDRRRGLPIFQSHGTFDPILPFEAGNHLHGLFVEHGMRVELTQFAGGHGVAPAALEALGRFLHRIVQETP